MKTTKESFSVIWRWISLLLVMFIGLVLITVLAGKGQTSEALDQAQIFIIPGIFLTGLIWFVVRIIKHVQQKKYFLESLRIRNIGALMGLSWFIILEVGIISVLRISYDGYCHAFWPASGEKDPACSFFEVLTSRQDFSATILLFFSTFFILFPIIMYVVGFFVDKYTAKKIKDAQVVN